MGIEEDRTAIPARRLMRAEESDIGIVGIVGAVGIVVGHNPAYR